MSSILYQHCSECSEPIRIGQQYTREPDAMHTVCYIKGLLKRYAELEEKLKGRAWRCFHCDEVFDDYEKARKHFGNIPTATPHCILKKCLCLDCPNSLTECAGRDQFIEG